MSSTWRDDPFQEGRRYRVRKTFSGIRDKFHEGEILRYKESAYSHHDGISGFFFTDEKEQIRTWDIYDDKTIAVWHDLFEPLN